MALRVLKRVTASQKHNAKKHTRNSNFRLCFVLFLGVFCIMFEINKFQPKSKIYVGS